jgi:hypothetical protein
MSPSELELSRRRLRIGTAVRKLNHPSPATGRARALIRHGGRERNGPRRQIRASSKAEWHPRNHAQFGLPMWDCPTVGGRGHAHCGRCAALRVRPFSWRAAQGGSPSRPGADLDPRKLVGAREPSHHGRWVVAGPTQGSARIREPPAALGSSPPRSDVQATCPRHLAAVCAGAFRFSRPDTWCDKPRDSSRAAGANVRSPLGPRADSCSHVRWTCCPCSLVSART